MVRHLFGTYPSTLEENRGDRHTLRRIWPAADATGRYFGVRGRSYSGRLAAAQYNALRRANVIGRVIRDDKTRFAGGNLVDYFQRLDADAAPAIVDKLLELTLAVPPPSIVRDQLIEVVHRPGDRSARIAEAIHALSTIPEFQVM